MPVAVLFTNSKQHADECVSSTSPHNAINKQSIDHNTTIVNCTQIMKGRHCGAFVTLMLRHQP